MIANTFIRVWIGVRSGGCNITFHKHKPLFCLMVEIYMIFAVIWLSTMRYCALFILFQWGTAILFSAKFCTMYFRSAQIPTCTWLKYHLKSLLYSAASKNWFFKTLGACQKPGGGCLGVIFMCAIFWLFISFVRLNIFLDMKLYLSGKI